MHGCTTGLTRESMVYSTLLGVLLLVCMSRWLLLTSTTPVIPAKPLHNHDIVSEHLSHFPCMGICDKLSRHLYMITDIYINVNEC